MATTVENTGALTDLDIMTRDALVANRNQVMASLPVLAIMMKHKRMQVGGKTSEVLVTRATGESTAQSYGPEDILTDNTVSRKAKVKFDWHRMQVPMKYSVDELEENHHADDKIQKLDMLAEKLPNAMDDLKRKIMADMFSTSTSESSKELTSICTALDHDTVYGGLTRNHSSYPQNDWFQGASLGGAYDDRATTVNADIVQVRNMTDVCMRFNHGKGVKFYAISGSTIWRKIQAQVESAGDCVVEKGEMAKYGFQAYQVDNIEFVRDYWFDVNSRTTDFFLLDPMTWEFEILPKRNFYNTPWKHQGENTNGKDQYLSRVFLSAKFRCVQPNANMWKSAMI